MSYLLQFFGDAPAGSGGWRKIAVVFNATATPIGVAGTILWTPPSPGYVRGLTANDDVAAPLTPAGGATTLQIHSGPGTTITFIQNITLATYGVQLNGWGVNGPSLANLAGGVGTQDSGVIVAPVGSIPGRPAIANRLIFGQSNAGTITGTLHLRFEFRAFASGAF